MSSNLSIACAFALVLSIPAASQEQRRVVAADVSATNAGGLTAEDREAIVERLAAGIEDGYVLEEKGHAIAGELRKMGRAGRFTDDDPKRLADTLTETLREISGDLHFRVTFGGAANAMGGPRRQMVRVPAGPPEASVGAGPRIVRRPAGSGSPGMTDLFDQMSKRFPDNYRAKILPGNVGLLEIDILFPPHDKLNAALQQLADTDALILDLRSCPGGTGSTTRPLESVFFEEPTHLVTMEQRGEEPVVIELVDETPGGVRYLDKPVFILTSNATGSACEEVAWALKYHDKAVLVGETTAGAGHAITNMLDLGHDLSATMPSMRPIHPRFEGGWEGVGVPPDVTIASRRAADEAYLLALSSLLEMKDGDERRSIESTYASTAIEVGRREREYIGQGRSLRSYSATFENGRRLAVKDGELYYYSDGRPRRPLRPLDQPDHFEVSTGIRKTILKVERDSRGEIISLATRMEGSDTWRRLSRIRAS